MSSGPSWHDEHHAEMLSLYAVGALPASEARDVEAQLAACAECRSQLETLRHTVASFSSWPTGIIGPEPSLWNRLARRIADETGTAPVAPPDGEPPTRAWDEVAPGTFCQLLATDPERRRVSMLVRLAPGASYPRHRHGGVEELYLLEGALQVDDRALHPGDYLRAEAGSVDQRVWSETGCTCVLLTSSDDELL